MEIQRIFIPGSEWLYFKLYTGFKTADSLLKSHIFDFLQELESRRLVKKMFFLRYSDPDFHIRLRLLLNNRDDYSIIFSEFHSRFSACVNNSMVSKIICDTYVRELERYGHETMELSEEIFHIDSKFALQLLLNEESGESRWKVAMILIDDLLEAFEYDIKRRYDFTLRLANSFKKEFGFESSVYTKQLNDKYRTVRQQIESAMKRESGLDETSYHIAKSRKEELSVVASKLLCEISVQDSNRQDELVSSFIHMSMNRLFRAKNRLSEMVVYDFISRYYKSENAKTKYRLE